MGTAMKKVRFTLTEIYQAESDPVIIRRLADLIDDQKKPDKDSLARDIKRADYLRALADQIEQER